MTTDPNLNALWSRAVAEELRRAGCAQVLLCPGSRNSPLLFALAAVFGDDAWSWIDERAAAFAALGVAKASGRPAAVCVTSGTAVANCLPAICEAGAMGIPLIVIAADRPWELQDRGAPQTMAQRGMFAAHATEVVIGEPIASEAALIALRSRVSQATQGDGPAVIHLPLRDPLPPLPDAQFCCDHLSSLARLGREQRPFTVVARRAGILPEEQTSWWEGAPELAGLDFLKPGLKGLIVVGASPGGMSPWPIELAEATGFPLIADVTSGLRGHALEHHVVLADALIAGPLRDAAPDLIIRIGPTPLHRGTWEWLQRQTCPTIVIDDGHDQDWLGTAWVRISTPHPQVWQTLGERLAPGELAWHDFWMHADRRAQKHLHTVMHDSAWCESLAAHLAVNHEGFSFLHLSASMPVRHANWHLVPRPHAVPAVFANRGVNGIDGCIATFAGAARTHGGNGLLVIGDIATLHDLGSLALAAREARDSAIVVLNNDGGGIFDHLPVAQVADYERLVRTPHGQTFAAAAAQAGLAYRAVEDRASLEEALNAASGSGVCTLIECRLTGHPNLEGHRALMQALVQ